MTQRSHIEKDELIKVLVEALKLSHDHINGIVNISGEGLIMIEQALAKAEAQS